MLVKTIDGVEYVTVVDALDEINNLRKLLATATDQLSRVKKAVHELVKVSL